VSQLVVWRAAAAIAAAALLAAPLASALDPLTLSQALQRAATSHPDLLGFDSERSGIEAQKALAGRSPTPELGLLLEDAFGDSPRSGLDSAQWTLSLSQALELEDQRTSRLSAAEARAAALASSQTQRRRDAMAEVTQRFIEAATDQQRLRLAEEQVELAKQALEAASARVSSARAPLAEQSRAQAALSQATLKREHAEHEAASARVALAVTMGSSEPDFGELQADLFILPAVVSLDDARKLLTTSPAAQARMAEAAVHQAEQRAALAAAGLRPTLTGGLRRYEQDDGMGMMLGFSLPLGAGRRARDEASIAAARFSQSEGENRAAHLRAEELLFDRYQELGHAREAMRLLDSEVLPALDEAHKQTRYAYDRGRYGYLELAQVLSELYVAQRERLDTAAHFHSLLADLERITGHSLIARTSP
jgi:cobalt-zinc-cadmium efflux system outer membrane protein